MKRDNTLAKEIMASVHPMATRRIETRMRVAKLLHDYLAASGVSQQALAEQMGKRPSEVSKWLSGNHNFTIDTLSDIGFFLNVDFLSRNEMCLFRCTETASIPHSGSRVIEFNTLMLNSHVPVREYKPSNKSEKCLA